MHLSSKCAYWQWVVFILLFGIFCSFVFIFRAYQSDFVVDSTLVQTEMSATRPITYTSQIYLPIIMVSPAKLTIAAAHIDSSISGEADEAILLWNSGEQRQSLAGWQLVTNSRRATFPLTTTLSLAGGEQLWCTAEATTFRQSFGEEPNCEWAEDSDPSIVNLDGRLGMANTGGYVQLQDTMGQVVDTFLYGNEERPQEGWNGPAAQQYTRGAIPSVGQVWQRKRDSSSGIPIDTDQASDWAGDLSDLDWGRQVRLPGWQRWDSEDFAMSSLEEAHATVTVLIGPEGLYQPLADAFNQATQTIDLSIYTFEHPELARIIVDAIQRGVTVRLLLEGSPPGGIDDLQKWSVAQIAEAGGEVRYMAVLEDAPNGYRTRYRYMHAKYAVIDGRQTLIGTENFNWDSMPVAQGSPVGGRRGFYLLTDAAPIAAKLTQIFEHDWQPERFLDLYPFIAEHPTYGGPPDNFVLPEPPVYNLDVSPFAEPHVVNRFARFDIVSAPENATRPDAGMMALIHRAGLGDEIMLAQLYEHKHWGERVSNPIADPNPRLQALIDAARRGATVRILLDRYFDDANNLRSNQATVDYLRLVASHESLPLEARVGNPTQGGLHAKLLLVRLNNDSSSDAGTTSETEYWSAVGSLNGGEVSHKINREVVLLTDMAEVYERLATVFMWDWQLGE